MKLEGEGKDSPLPALARRCGGRWGVLVLFVVLDVLLTVLGHALQESAAAPAVFWPSAGLLLAAIWLTDRSWWLALCLVHLLVETLYGIGLNGGAVWQHELLIAAADVIDGLVGAIVGRRLLRDPASIHAHQVLSFLLAAAIGAAAGALLGAWVNSAYIYTDLSYPRQLQLWWAGNWLGSVAVAPVVHGWTMSLWNRFPEVKLRSRVELAVLATLLLAASAYVFSMEPGDASSLIQLPVVVFALLSYAAFRFPPRWAVALGAMVVLVTGWLSSRGVGPFDATDPFARTAQVQTFLATLVVVTHLFSTALTEMRIAIRRLSESEFRYRNFVQMSSEAVWCIELLEPMPTTLPLEEMTAWLRRNGRVAECSLSYGEVDPEGLAERARPLRGDSVWSGVYRQYLEEVAQQHFCCTNFRVATRVNGQPRTFVASFNGVVEDGCLRRIWGVARDVTELMELNAKLLREQDRLKSYARALMSAEDRARRSTAVDLHDGIGQVLIGMGMTLEVACAQSPADTRLLLDEVRGRLREVQDRTRGMISDLSPPGLYDLGLAPALSWLVVYFRSHDRLEVLLDCQVPEERVSLELRILVFKLVRELLRNVVKHSGVRAARVNVRGEAQGLRIEVRDNGRGFEWQMDLFGSTRGGFGLWSMADRVAEAGGRFHVDTAPGRGARFELMLPFRTPPDVVESQPAGRAFG
jgi:signal transduction histidine kinase